MGFTGILGHEFVGVVESVIEEEEEQAVVESDKQQPKKKYSHWIGKRVCGDINVACCSTASSKSNNSNTTDCCHVCDKSYDDYCVRILSTLVSVSHYLSLL